MSISVLPAEILSSIFSHLQSRNDTYECMKVCKIWCRKLLPTYYAAIELDQYHDKFYQYAQQTILSDQYHIGSLVQTLIFYYRRSSLTKKLTRVQFEILLSNLPNLKVIIFASHRNIQLTASYMQFLENKVAGTNIEEVSVPKFMAWDKKVKRIYQYHYTINEQLKHQIKKLSIHSFRIEALKGDSSVVLDYLAGFTNLKHLVLSNIETDKGSREGIHTTSILGVCHNLESLQLDNMFSWTVSVDHKCHYNLTSLTLTLPDFTADHLGYLAEYVPNLKDLKLIIGKNTLLDIYTLADPRMTACMLNYLKNLQLVSIHSASRTQAQDTSLFWHMLQGIYDGEIRGNLRIQLNSGRGQIEMIHFNKQMQLFEVMVQWNLASLFSLSALPFNFLKLNSIHIEDNVGSEYSVYDLLDSLLQDRNTQLRIKRLDQVITLSTKQVGSKIRFPQPGSIVQYARLENISLDNDSINKIGTFYPTINLISLHHCRIPKENERTNHYTLDLHGFNNICNLVFDFDVTLPKKRKIRPIYFQCMTEQDMKYYYHYHQVDTEDTLSLEAFYSTGVIYPIDTPEMIPKSMYVIKIKCKSLQKFAFKRLGVKLRIK